MARFQCRSNWLVLIENWFPEFIAAGSVSRGRKRRFETNLLKIVLERKKNDHFYGTRYSFKVFTVFFNRVYLPLPQKRKMTEITKKKTRKLLELNEQFLLFKKIGSWWTLWKLMKSIFLSEQLWNGKIRIEVLSLNEFWCRLGKMSLKVDPIKWVPQESALPYS